MATGQKVRVIIVDDIAETRENVRKLLQFESDMPTEPQKFGSAFTYMRRYSMQGVTQTVAEEDDDAEITRAASKATKEPEVNW